MSVLPSATISSLVDLAGDMKQVDGEVRWHERPCRMRQSHDAADGLLGRQEASILLVHGNPLFDNGAKMILPDAIVKARFGTVAYTTRSLWKSV